MSDYEQLLSSWRSAPEDFWRDAAGELEWEVSPTEILHREGDSYRWFADGRLSACHNLID
uniref:acetyl-coenzyme A synthetase N-terminal domain-containing protein n=1 Tax=Emcibacter sp. TaxID=1979954 RepID=UPI003A938A0F